MSTPVVCNAKHLNLDPAEGVKLRFVSVANQYLLEGSSLVLPDSDDDSLAATVTLDDDGLGTVNLAAGQYLVIPTVGTSGKTYLPFYVTVPSAVVAYLKDIRNLPPPPTLDAAQAAVLAAQEARDAALAARNEAINAASGQAIFEALVENEAEGLAATSVGETFVVPAGGQLTLYQKSSTGTALLISQPFVPPNSRLVPAKPPTGAAIVAAAAILGLKEIPLQMILGRDYDAATDDWAALISAVGLAVMETAGLPVVDDIGLDLLWITAIQCPAVWDIDLSKSKITKRLNNTGVSNAAIRNTDNNVAMTKFRWKGGKLRGETADTGGTLMRIHAADISVTHIDMEFQNGIGISLNGTDTGRIEFTHNRVKSIEVTEGSGDACVRIGGGYNIIRHSNDLEADEDTGPLATNTSPGSDLVNRNTRNAVVSNEVHRTNGRLAGAIGASSNPSAANSTHTGKHENITIQGLRGEWKSGLFRINFDNVAEGVVSADNITLRDIKGYPREPAPRSVAAQIVGWWYGTVGRVALYDIVLPDPKRPFGLEVDAPGMDLTAADLKITGGRHALRWKRPDKGIARFHNTEWTATNANLTLDDDEVDDFDVGITDRRDPIRVDDPNRDAQTYIIFDNRGGVNDTVVVGAITYRLRDTLVQAYDVLRGSNDPDDEVGAAEAAANLVAAITRTGTPGVQYFDVGTLVHPTVTASVPKPSKPHRVAITPLASGAAGNGIAVSITETAGSVKNATTVGGYTPIGRQQLIFTGKTIIRGVYSPTIDSVLTPMSGVAAASGANNVDFFFEDLEVWKTPGATGNWAVNAPAGCTVTIGRLSGDVDNLGVTGGAAYCIGEWKFQTRAVFVAYQALVKPQIGQIATAAGLSYRYIGTGTAISDMSGWVPDGDIYPDHFAVNTTPATTDMTAAIQAAVDYCAAISIGGQGKPLVHFLGTEYRVEDTITISHNFCGFVGEGPRQTLISVRADCGDVFHFTAADPTTTTLSGITMRNLAVRSFVDTTSGALVRLTRCQDVYFDNVRLDDHFGHVLVEGGINMSFVAVNNGGARAGVWSGIKAGSYWWKFTEGPAAQQKTPAGIFLTGCDNARNGSNNYVENGIIVNACDGLWITGGHVMGVDQADMLVEPIVTALSASGSQITGIMTSNFWFDNNSKYGIRIKGTSNSFGNFTFTGSRWLTNTVYGIWIEPSCNVGNVSVTGGGMVKPGLSGVRLDASETFIMTGVTIAGAGSELSTERAAVYLDGTAQNFTATGCVFTNFIDTASAPATNTQYGVYVNSNTVDYVNVSGCVFDGMTAADVRDNNTGVEKNYQGNVTSDTFGDATASGTSLTIDPVRSYYRVDSTVTTFDNVTHRHRDRVVTLEFEGDCTVTHTNNQLELRGQQDAIFSAEDTLTLRYEDRDTKWLEVGRSQKADGWRAATIAAGVLTIIGDRNNYTIDTEAAAATDDLDSISGGYDGQTIVLNTTSSVRDVVVKNGTANIFCGADRTLNTLGDMIVLQRKGSSWYLRSFADN